MNLSINFYDRTAWKNINFSKRNLDVLFEIKKRKLFYMDFKKSIMATWYNNFVSLH